MAESIEKDEKSKIFFSGFKFIGKILCAIFIILILLVPFMMIIYKNDTADSAFKDHKDEWDKITKEFKTET